MANKLAVLTGASAGIGKALSRQLAAKGYDLVLIARRENLLKEIKTELEEKHQVKVSYLICDMTDKEQYTALAEKLEKMKIDIFFNNAGVGYFGSVYKQDPKRLDDMITLCVNSLTYLSCTVNRQMARDGGGILVNVSSIAAYAPYFPSSAVYAASKKYVRELSKAMNFENEKENTNVRVVSLQPGAIATEWQQNALPGKPTEYKHEKMYQDPNLFAEKVLAKILSGKDDFAYGPMSRASKVGAKMPGRVMANAFYKMVQKRMLNEPKQEGQGTQKETAK